MRESRYVLAYALLPHFSKLFRVKSEYLSLSILIQPVFTGAEAISKQEEIASNETEPSRT